jgi:hypothetical protein
VSVEDFTKRKPPSSSDFLSFRLTNRPIELSDIQSEFTLMQEALGKHLTPEIAARICEKSGTHILKLVSPRVDGDHAVLRISASGTNQRPSILPSVNALDIPYCKVVFRPLETIGYAPRSIVDHILNPEDHSDRVLSAFAEVFGADVLQAMRDVMQAEAPSPLKLGAGEFPIIFVPHPSGGDLQITPVAPAVAFMGMKRVADAYFQKKSKENPTPLRGRWSKQSVSSKPQNISGAIGGTRVRFMANLPDVMGTEEAELYSFVQGGGFPRWRAEDINVWVMRYADMLDADRTYNDQNTRAALNRVADQLIREADAFISDILSEARDLAVHQGKEAFLPTDIPGVAQVLARRRWGNSERRDRSRKALTSPHFEYRIYLFRSMTGVIDVLF